MNISIEHRDGKFPSFNVSLASKEGAEPFLTIKGCRIVSGQKGEFVSYPSRKQDDGKYWNHVWGSEKFNAAVLEKAQAAQPKRQDGDSDIPW
jgi:DNA-binding cell septation regulator SpoVG